MAFLKCSKCGREFHGCSVRQCPHEAVRRRFGVNICMYCCQPCKHNRFVENGQECQQKKSA